MKNAEYLCIPFFGKIRLFCYYTLEFKHKHQKDSKYFKIIHNNILQSIDFYIKIKKKE